MKSQIMFGLVFLSMVCDFWYFHVIFSAKLLTEPGLSQESFRYPWKLCPIFLKLPFISGARPFEQYSIVNLCFLVLKWIDREWQVSRNGIAWVKFDGLGVFEAKPNQREKPCVWITYLAIIWSPISISFVRRRQTTECSTKRLGFRLQYRTPSCIFLGTRSL